MPRKKREEINPLDTKYPHLFALFDIYMPNSDKVLAKRMGVSVQTIKRLRTGNYNCTDATEEKIYKYLRIIYLKLARLFPEEKVNPREEDRLIWFDTD